MAAATRPRGLPCDKLFINVSIQTSERVSLSCTFVIAPVARRFMLLTTPLCPHPRTQTFGHQPASTYTEKRHPLGHILAIGKQTVVTKVRQYRGVTQLHEDRPTLSRAGSARPSYDDAD